MSNIVVLAILVIMIFGFLLPALYLASTGMPPTAEDRWADAAAAYPNGSTECHAAVVDRILRMSVVLLDSPHVADNPYSNLDERQAGMMATNMTLGGEWRAPECGDAEPQPWRTEDGESDRKHGWRGDRGGARGAQADGGTGDSP